MIVHVLAELKGPQITGSFVYETHKYSLPILYLVVHFSQAHEDVYVKGKLFYFTLNT